MPDNPVPDARRVFVVHGRNLEARDALFALLRAFDLNPIEWEEAISLTRQGSPYIGSALEAAFASAQAAVILLTGDDMGRLGRRYLLPHDPITEKHLTRQARANVIFEAGMAFGKYPDRTVIVALGPVREFSDIVGRHVVHLSNSSLRRQALSDRLKNAGCPVRTEYKSDWHSAGDFEAGLHDPDIPQGSNPFRLRLLSRHATFDNNASFQQKIWFKFKNESEECIELRHYKWKETQGGVNASVISSTLQIQLGTVWCPQAQGVERLQLPPGELLQTWVYLGEQYTHEDLIRRCKSDETLGSLILLANGIKIELPV